MKLLIDIGNTSAKLAVSDNGIVHFEHLTETWAQTFSRLSTVFDITTVRISTVAGEDNELDTALTMLGKPILRLTPDIPCPIKPITNIPTGFGSDRWAADIGALSQDAEHTLLVIDSGTCITYDFISREGAILGGAISPGVQLRLNAMHEHTALLPSLKAPNDAKVIGADTRSAMLSAAINGTRFEMEGYIRHLLKDYPDLHVFLTGGYAFHFSDDIICPITHDPYLLFKGLDAI